MWKRKVLIISQRVLREQKTASGIQNKHHVCLGGEDLDSTASNHIDTHWGPFPPSCKQQPRIWIDVLPSNAQQRFLPNETSHKGKPIIYFKVNSNSPFCVVFWYKNLNVKQIASLEAYLQSIGLKDIHPKCRHYGAYIASCSYRTLRMNQHLGQLFSTIATLWCVVFSSQNSLASMA